MLRDFNPRPITITYKYVNNSTKDLTHIFFNLNQPVLKYTESDSEKSYQYFSGSKIMYFSINKVKLFLHIQEFFLIKRSYLTFSTFIIKIPHL